MNTSMHTEITKSNSCLFHFHLRERTDLPVTSSSLYVSVPPGLKTYLISGRKVEPHSHCNCSQLGLAGPEHAEPRCPASRVQTPDGAPAACTLPPDNVKVSARYPWENLRNISHVVAAVTLFLGIFLFYFYLYCLRKNNELHVLLQPLWCLSLCSLCAFVYVGVSEALIHIFHFFHASFCLRGGEEENTLIPVITLHLNFPFIPCNYMVWTFGSLLG